MIHWRSLISDQRILSLSLPLSLFAQRICPTPFRVDAEGGRVNNVEFTSDIKNIHSKVWNQRAQESQL